MKNKNSLTIRYMGEDSRRRYSIQRGDDKYWTGTGWTRILDMIKFFKDQGDVVKTCVALQHKRLRGKPIRTFKVQMTITLVDDDVKNIRPEDLIKFLTIAAKVEMDNAVFGDGPDDSFVYAQMNFSTLEEVSSTRKVF